MFKKTTLKNGLKIITVPQKGTQAVTVLVLVGTGSKYETKEISGISHLLEHLLFKGTKKRPSQISISEPLDRVGGIYNAFTGEDYTGYFAKVDARHFNLALDVISDIYLNSKIDSKEIQKEKAVIVEEINMYFDHPSSYVQSLWNRILYGDQPAGWDIAGTKKSVLGISRKQIVDYMKTQYTGNNTIVCIAGDIPKDAEPKVKKYFSKISTKKIVNKSPVVEYQSQPEALVYYKNTDQTHFCLGVRGYDLDDPKRFALELLGSILGGMMSSRLFIKVREQLGLAYYVRTAVSADPDTGFLVTQAGVDNKRIDKAITVILEEYKKISQKKISADELKKAKDHYKGKMALLFEASDAQASFYGAQELLEKRILTPEQIYARINKVSINDILEVSKDIFKSEKLNLALIGPFKDKTRFQNILNTWITKKF
ncbi:insulinase family protein [Patescibacteria group bacterium]|nr:insulinase family protein [Patescibacteria group bacterium]